MLEFCKGDRQRYKDKKEEPRNEAPLAFNCPNQYSYFKKGSDSVDFYCNTLKFENSRITLNQGFSFLLKRNDPLFNFCKHNVFAKFW